MPCLINVRLLVLCYTNNLRAKMFVVPVNALSSLTVNIFSNALDALLLLDEWTWSCTEFVWITSRGQFNFISSVHLLEKRCIRHGHPHVCEYIRLLFFTFIYTKLLKSFIWWYFQTHLSGNIESFQLSIHSHMYLYRHTYLHLLIHPHLWLSI